MDSSDRIRKLQAKAVYTDYKAQKLVNQANCNLVTCSSINGCVLQYPNYAERQAVAYGSQLCRGCTALGCGCS